MNAREAAAAAAEAIHQLNYATLPWDGYPGLEYSSDVYSVVGSLSAMAGMLPQALGQLASWINREHEAGRIILDRMKADEPGELWQRLATLSLMLGTAAGCAVNMRVALDEAHIASGRMAAPEPGGES